MPAGSAAGGQFMAYNAATKRGTGYGKRGGDPGAKRAQTALNALGFTDDDGDELELDGKIGPRSTAAVKKFQRSIGVTPDGRITPALLARLEAAAKAKKSAAAPAKPAKKTTPAKKPTASRARSSGQSAQKPAEAPKRSAREVMAMAMAQQSKRSR